MGENSKIEWTDHTFNPWIGCQKVSPACDRCYAEAMMDHRYGKVRWGPGEERKRTSAANWRKPLQWAKAARASGTRRRPRVFCASLADVFDNAVPAQWRNDLWWLIAATPELDWLLLTKRPQNVAKMLKMLPGGLDRGWPNVWLGTTAENQEEADRRIPALLRAPQRVAVRFVSCEPLLAQLDISPYLAGLDRRERFSDRVEDRAGRAVAGISWTIIGGETGPGYRQMKPEWAGALIEQCRSAGTAVFMKQMSGRAPIPADLMVREFPR